MKIDDLSAPSGRFVARVSASVATVDRCPGRGRVLPAADNDSLRSSPYAPRSTLSSSSAASDVYKRQLLRSPCRPRWVRRRPKRIVVGCRQSPPAAGAAIDGVDECRNTSDESPRRSRSRQSSYVARVCEIAIISGGEREPTQDSTFRAGHEPTQTDTRTKRERSTLQPV